MALQWKDFLTRIRGSAIEKELPYYASFELTPRCNFNCKMCYICRPVNDNEARTKELTAEQWIRLAREVRDAGVLILTLSGGEVFIRPDFREIYEEISRMGFLVKIFSNGSMITREVVEWLGKMPPFMISITLYGSSRETYRKITGHADGYDRAVKAVDSLMAAGIATEMKTTFIRDNITEFEQMLRLFRERKRELGVISYVSPRREGVNSDPESCRLSPEEFAAFDKRVGDIYHLERAKSNKNAKGINNDAVVDECKTHVSGDPRWPFQCSAGKNGFSISWNGNLTPCSMLDQPFTRVLDKGFPDAWKELQNKCRQVPSCRECDQCSYRSTCYTCPARLFRETGSFNKPAPYLCQAARLYAEKLNC